MYKPSDALDFTDKVVEMHNYYIEEQKQKIIAEIKWLQDNEEDTGALRSYLTTRYNPYLVLNLDDNDLHQLAEIHGNTLNTQLFQLCRQQTDTKPLKIIVQELKLLGH